MRLLTYSAPSGRRLGAAVDGDEVVDLSGPLAEHGVIVHDVGDLLVTGASGLAAARSVVATAPSLGSIGEVGLATPVLRPGKIVAVAANYRKHMEETRTMRYESPDSASPWLFQKPLTSLCGPGDDIPVPALTERFDWEAEIGVVIGRRASRVSEAEALDHVAGYTVVNDLSARNLLVPRPESRRPFDDFCDWLQGKWFDRSCPVGPCVLTADEVEDPRSLTVGCAVNGETMQEDTAASMIFSIPRLISYASHITTLEAGDLVATGTPEGVGKARGQFLAPGDVLRTWVEGIGVLENRLVEPTA